MSNLLYFFVSFLFLISSGCQSKKISYGTLHIKSKLPGEYEVFQVKSENPPQVVAEKLGLYNHDLKLRPGKYIILADCSSEALVLSENQKETLYVGGVELELPKSGFEEAFPLVQCERSTLLGIKQKLQNRRTLQVLPTQQHILIGPAAFALEMGKLSAHFEDTKNIQLGAIVVGTPEDKGSYFVSGINTAAPVSQSQELGVPMFLLPGEYLVELNGTKNTVTIEPLETKVQTVGYFVINTPKTGLAIKDVHQSELSFVETKTGAVYELNKSYIVLPGKLSIRIGSTQYYHDVSIEDKKLTAIDLSAVVVAIDCEPPEVLCHKKQRVFLFQGDNPYFFSQGFTNEIIYHWFLEPIKISLNTTESIYRKVASGSAVVNESFGRLDLHLIRHRSSNPDVKTNFLRVLPKSFKLEGQSYDIDFNGNEARLNLFAGNYHLVHHMARVGKIFDPIVKNVSFKIQAGRTTHLVMDVY